MALVDILHLNLLSGASQSQSSSAGNGSRSGLSVGELVGTTGLGVVVGSVAAGVTR